ncbi:MAG: helix-hairpin-helix domain-containing protein [Patescibacteria group bacterium]
MIEDNFLLTAFTVALTFAVLWLVHELFTRREIGQLSFRGLDQPPPPVAPAIELDDLGEDDLTRIEGIGPKISELLTSSGYQTFADVAAASSEELKSVLVGGGSRFDMHDPGSWPKQAALASDGEWDRLEKLQSQLKGGK